MWSHLNSIRMKFVLILFLLVAAARGNDFGGDIDWSTVKRRDVKIPLPFDFDEVLFDQRIVGGEEAFPNTIPYQAALFINTAEGIFFCGGSLISQRFVLTAAHCVDIATEVEVRLGAHRVNENESTQVRYITNKVSVHPGWNPSTLINDIAVVELPEPAFLSETVQLIPLPRYSDIGTTFAGSVGRISGWGIDSDLSTIISPVLRFVNVDVITNLVCNISYLGIIQSTHICTSGAGGRGPCSGDSGGPLVAEGRQVGIASFALALGCEIGWPAGYARVTSFLDWLAANTDANIS